MHFGKAITKLLEKKGEPKSWLAEEMGLTRPGMTRVLKEKEASSRTIRQAAKAFNMKRWSIVRLAELERF